MEKKHTEESKNKMSEAAKKRKLSNKTRRQISRAMKGREFSQQHRQKMSENNARYWKGKTLSEEHRQKIAIAAEKRASRDNDDFKNISPDYFTDIEEITKNFFEEHNIGYLHNKRIGSYFPDFIILDNVIIECDGEYWHKERDNKDRRDEYFRNKGFLIFHVRGDEIKSDFRKEFAGVLTRIRKDKVLNK